MKTTLRFFIYDLADDTDDLVPVEVGEREFLAAAGAIEYERHTVFENGVAQVCLTKNPFVEDA